MGNITLLKETCQFVVCKDRSLILIGCLSGNNFISLFRFGFPTQRNQTKEINGVLCGKAVFILIFIARTIF